MNCVDCGCPVAKPSYGAYPKRCAACTAAHEQRITAGRLQYGERRLVAACWCDRTTVWVPQSMLRQGITRSCGAPECRNAA